MSGWKTDRRSRHERGYGTAWDKIRKQALQRDHYLCRACMMEGRITPLKVKPKDHAVDHIIPKSKGGTDDLSNLQSLCTPCHEAKTDRDEGRNQFRKVGPDGYPI